jgi:exopolyphosphatase/guanosine-5'-triphosphate,3'-diphosphate pyrophosphatase
LGTTERKRAGAADRLCRAFDTLADLLEKTPSSTKYRTRLNISLHDFSRISEEVICSTRAEREKMTGMDQLRIEMIVPAFLFTRLVVNRLHIGLISQTGYSLREGVLFEQINC